MPEIVLPGDGEKPYGTKLRTAINAVNDAVDAATEAIADGSAVTDSAVTALLSDPDSDTRAELNSAIAAAIVASGVTQDARSLDAAISILDMRQMSTFTCALASDSTADGSVEWYETAWQALFAQVWPDRPARLIRWGKVSGAYIDPIVWQTAETPAVPPSGEVSTPNSPIGADDFNAASATELNGRAPDLGATGASWASTAGAFKTISGVVYSTATSGSGFACYFNLLARSGIDMRATARVRFNTNPTAAQRSFTLTGPFLNTANVVQVTLTRPTTGSSTLKITKTINGVSEDLATFPAGTIPDNTIGEYTFSIEVSGTTVTAIVNGVTATGTLTAGDLTALAGANRGGFRGNLANDAEFRLSEYRAYGTVITPANPGSPAVPSIYPYATIYNASAAGENASYQQARLDQMFPVRPDILMIAHGHNYGSSTPADFLTAIDAFVDAFHAKWSGVPVWAVSQNPEYGSGAAAHAARQVALRDHCIARGWGYIPGFEAFAARPDGGKSYVNGTDLVHPLPAGNSLWRDTAKTAIKARSRRP